MRKKVTGKKEQICCVLNRHKLVDVRKEKLYIHIHIIEKNNKYLLLNNFVNLKKGFIRKRIKALEYFYS